MPPIQIIGVACGAGASDPGCAAGPDRLQDSGLVLHLQAQGIELSWRTTLYPDAVAPPLLAVRDISQRLAHEVSLVAAADNLPLVVGGDHSCAIGTWSGAFVSVRARGPLGLIWIDAHMDSHTPQTSPSGALHGMPLAVLLGHGAPELVDIATPGAKLLARHVCLIGVRSYEQGEAKLLRSLGVRVFFMEEVKQRGMDAVMAQALAIAGNGSAGFGISIDLDAFNPGESPGVGTPVRDGLHHMELDRVLRGITGHPGLVALELAEYNPHRDRQQRTLRLIENLVAALGLPAS